MFVPSTAIIKFWILLSCANLWQSENLHQMKKIFGIILDGSLVTYCSITEILDTRLDVKNFIKQVD